MFHFKFSFKEECWALKNVCDQGCQIFLGAWDQNRI
jgi:hypothetical protein